MARLLAGVQVLIAVLQDAAQDLKADTLQARMFLVRVH